MKKVTGCALSYLLYWLAGLFWQLPIRRVHWYTKIILLSAKLQIWGGKGPWKGGPGIHVGRTE